eukprot:gene13303-15638_t
MDGDQLYTFQLEDQSEDRPQPAVVENFVLLPGEHVLLATTNVVHLSVTDNKHKIGTLYQTNFQLFFVDDSKKPQQHTKKEKKEKESTLPRSISESSNISSQSDTAWANGASERALILEIRCKDFNIIRLCLPTSEKGIEAHATLCRMSFLDNPSSFFATSYTPFKGTMNFNGWNIYDAVEEQGLLTPGGEWRLTKINNKYDICSTYPQYLVIPFSISDYLIQKSASFRSKNRFPVCTWRHRYTHASLSRCSQPLNGIGKNRCEEDELLIQAIRKCTPASATPITSASSVQPTGPQPIQPTANQQPLYIFDVRPKSTVGSFSGNSTEDLANYPNCILEFGNLSNIHELRESSNKLFKVVRNWDDKKSWSEVAHTGWLNQIAKLLTASKRILNILHVEGLSVVVHCTDGWDRTSQLMSIVQVLADPYYRTMKGFIVLICKEWISYGHKFMTRSGALTSLNVKQTSPIFLQFIDCIWQLTRQFPTSFEFSDQFLFAIFNHFHSNLFGTFLYDSDRDRQIQKISTETVSLWTFLYGCIKEGVFANPLYVKTTENEPMGASGSSNINNNNENVSTQFVIRKNYDNANVLVPNIQGVQLWTDFYLRWKTTVIKPSKKPLALVDRALGVHGFNGDLMYIPKRKKDRRRDSSAKRSKSLSSDSLTASHGNNNKHKSTRLKSSKKSKSSKSRENLTDGLSASPLISSSINANVSSDTNRLPIEEETIQDVPTIITTTTTTTTTTNSTLPVQEETTTDANNSNTLEVVGDQRSRRHSTSNSSPALLSEPTPFIEPSTPLSPGDDSPSAGPPILSPLSMSVKEKELNRERRREKKERRARERVVRRENKEQKKQEKKEKEKKAPDITVVLSSANKSKPISLTMPVRGTKSRMSIISTSSPPPPASMTSPPQQSQPLSPPQPAQNSENGNQQPAANSSSFSRLFKTLAIRGQKA